MNNHNSFVHKSFIVDVNRKIMAVIMLSCFISHNVRCLDSSLDSTKDGDVKEKAINVLASKKNPDVISVGKKIKSMDISNNQKDTKNVIENNKVSKDNFMLKKDNIFFMFLVGLSLVANVADIKSRISGWKQEKIRNYIQKLEDIFEFQYRKKIRVDFFKPDEFDSYVYLCSEFNNTEPKKNELMQKNDDSIQDELKAKLCNFINYVSDIYLPVVLKNMEINDLKKFVVEYLIENVAVKCGDIKDNKLCSSFKVKENEIEFIFNIKCCTCKYKLVEIIVANHSEKEVAGFKLELYEN